MNASQKLGVVNKRVSTIINKEAVFLKTDCMCPSSRLTGCEVCSERKTLRELSKPMVYITSFE